ncbi:putative ELM2 domain-containing protein [Helianthus anomalus]
MLNVDDLVSEQAAYAEVQKEKVIYDVEGDDVDKDTTSSLSSSDAEIDETERLRRIQEATEKENLLRKRKRQEKEDAPYVPSPQHVSGSQSPSSISPRIIKPKIVLKKKPTKESKKPPTPPHEPTPHHSPLQSPPHQSPPRQPSPLHLSPLHISPPQQQTLLTSQEIFQTPPLTQIQLTPGSSGHKGLHIPPDNLEDIGDFGFENDEQVKKLEKKVDDVLNENKVIAAESKKVADRKRILEMRVKRLESDNKELLKKIDTDQTHIDFLKVRVSELEEEKDRRGEQNKYFELKNKELEAAKTMKEHEFYMLSKVVKNMLGKSVEQRFEEIAVEELRAKHQAEINEQMKDKGKDVSLEDLIVGDNDDDDDDDDEEDEEEEKDDKKEDDDDEKVFSASSHGSDNDDDDA